MPDSALDSQQWESGHGCPTISIVIPTFNSGRTLGACLDSVRREFPHPHEVVVVDDTRTNDLTRALCGRYRVDVVVDDAGMAESRNIGARACRGEYILHLDSDMVLPDGFRSALARALAASPADALVIPERSIGEGPWIRARQIDKDVVRHLRVGESVRLVRRTVMERLGGYDPTLLGGEDADFDRRLRASGVRVSRLKDSAIIHDDGLITLRALARKKYGYGRTLRNYEGRHGRLYSGTEVIRRVAVGTSWASREDWITGIRYLCLKGVEFGAGAVGRVGSTLRVTQDQRLPGRADIDIHVSLMSVVGTTPSGGDLAVLRLVRALTAQGASVRVVTTDDQFGQAEWTPMLEGLTEVEVVQDPTGRTRGPLAAYLSRCIRILTSSRTRGSVSTALVIGSPFLPDLAMLAANRRASTVFIAWQLEIPHPLGEGLRRQTRGMRATERMSTQLRTAFSFASQALMLRMAAHRRCTMLVINERLEAACLERGMERDRVIRWSYGVDRQPEPSHGFDQRPVDFCFVGRLHSQKGIVDLLGAWTRLSAQLPASRLTIVGGGSGRFADWCRQEFEVLGAGLEYRGPLEGDAKWSVLRDTRVLLFPSTYESFGLVALEAMAAGAVVVGYDTDVNRSMFGDGMVRVPRGDPGALADAAAGCFTDRNRWEDQHRLSLATATRYEWETSTGAVAGRVVEECRAPHGVP